MLFPALRKGVGLLDKNAIAYWCTINEITFCYMLAFFIAYYTTPNHYEESPLRPRVYPIYHKL